MQRMRSFVVVVAALCAIASVSHAQRPPKGEHALETEIARSEAVEASRAGLWAEALVAIDKAIASEASWSELYLLRAGIHVGNAGPDSDSASMRRIRRGADYPRIVRELEAAAADWEAFLKMEPTSKQRATLLQAIGEIRARARLARGLGERRAKIVALEEAYARGQPGQCENGRVLVDKIHCCFPGQTWEGRFGRCHGACPTGYTLVNANSGVIQGCLAPISRRYAGQASGSCRDSGHSSHYLYEPSIWDEETQRMADQFELASTNPLIAFSSYRANADGCVLQGADFCCD